jgi:hypothetical protein
MPDGHAPPHAPAFVTTPHGSVGPVHEQATPSFTQARALAQSPLQLGGLPPQMLTPSVVVVKVGQVSVLVGLVTVVVVETGTVVVPPDTVVVVATDPQHSPSAARSTWTSRRLQAVRILIVPPSAPFFERAHSTSARAAVGATSRMATTIASVRTARS